MKLFCLLFAIAAFVSSPNAFGRDKCAEDLMRWPLPEGSYIIQTTETNGVNQIVSCGRYDIFGGRPTPSDILELVEIRVGNAEEVVTAKGPVCFKCHKE